jgi:hypothetical protein
MFSNDPTNPGETETTPSPETIVITTVAEAALGAFLYVF